ASGVWTCGVGAMGRHLEGVGWLVGIARIAGRTSRPQAVGGAACGVPAGDRRRGLRVHRRPGARSSMSIQELIAGLPAPKPLSLGETALFLDLDGTLAPIAARPQDVRPDPRRTSLLERLAQKLDGRLAVVSGRTLADVDRILEGCVTPVAAVHGLVRRGPDGRLHERRPHPALAEATAGFRAFAMRDSGLIVEEKSGLSVALHFRLASRHAEAARACARELAGQTGLSLQDGD